MADPRRRSRTGPRRRLVGPMGAGARDPYRPSRAADPAAETRPYGASRQRLIQRRSTLGARGRAAVAGLTLVLIGGAVAAGAAGLFPGSGRAPRGATASPGPSAGESARLGRSGPVPSQPPVQAGLPAVATLDPPAERFTREMVAEITGSIPPQIAGRADYRMKVYLNGELLRNRRVPDTPEFRLKRLELAPGANEISVSLKGPRGEGERSDPITITLDIESPPIELTSPTEGQVVNGERARLVGTTEPGSRITARNETLAAASPDRPSTPVTGTAGPDGSFEVAVPLGPETNVLTLTATDPAGNASTRSLSVVKGDAPTGALLSLSTDRLEIHRLPTTLSIRVRVSDPDDQPIEGATVVFTLSPPGISTSTFEQLTGSDGTASWPGVTIPRDGIIASDGFVTVLVTTPDGTVLTDTAEFRVTD